MPFGLLVGDTRASEQPGLTSIHTVYMREHNRIVNELAQINPHWNDEQLFQNGRRILSAEFQHMTYNEFLPRVLGWNAIQLYDLKVLTEGYYGGKGSHSRILYTSFFFCSIGCFIVGFCFGFVFRIRSHLQPDDFH